MAELIESLVIKLPYLSFITWTSGFISRAFIALAVQNCGIPSKIWEKNISNHLGGGSGIAHYEYRK